MFKGISCLLLFLTFFYVCLFFSSKARAAITFTIATDQTTITYNQEFTLNVTITGLTSCTICYIQSRITQTTTSRYFGFTQKEDGSWYSYISSPSPETIQTTFFAFQPQDGSWSGTIKAKVDIEDNNFKGTGEYRVQLLRYTGNSPTRSESNDLGITIQDERPIPMLTPTPTTKQTPTPKQEEDKSTVTKKLSSK